MKFSVVTALLLGVFAAMDNDADQKHGGADSLELFSLPPSIKEMGSPYVIFLLLFALNGPYCI